MSSILQSIKNLNKKTVIIALVIIIIIIIGVGLTMNATRPYSITAIRSISKFPGTLDIAWKDDEEDVIYTIYWSDKDGINVHNRETFKFHKQVVGHRTSIQVPYTYVYFRISKNNFVSKEYMNMVMTDASFCKKNLGIRFVRGRQNSFSSLEEPRSSAKKGNIISIEVKVLEMADVYRIYHYHNSDDFGSRGKIFQQDYIVKDFTNVILKIPVIEDAMVFISFLKDGYESEMEFLWHSGSKDEEKISIEMDEKEGEKIVNFVAEEKEKILL